MCTELIDLAMRDRVFHIVRAELLRVRREQAPNFDVDIRMESSLVTDVGLDSLSLVEAAVALEQALCIDRLPLDSLSDRESVGDGEPFTVASLVSLCMEQAPADGRFRA